MLEIAGGIVLAVVFLATALLALYVLIRGLFALIDAVDDGVEHCRLQWLESRANRGDPRAQLALAEHLSGPHRKADRLKWCRRAAEQGLVEAEGRMGQILFQPGTHAESAMWYQKAADKGHAFSQSELGRMYEHGVGLNKDPVKAYMWYSLAVEDEDGAFWARTPRDALEATLSQDDLIAAERLVQEWKASRGISSSMRS